MSQAIEAEIPQCQDATGPHAEAFNHLLRSLVLEQIEGFHDTFPQGARSITSELVGPFGGVLSVRLRVTEFIGAAHPNQDIITVNYDWRDGRRLRLADLFLDGADFETTLGRHCEPQLPHPDATETDGEPSLGIDDAWWSLAEDGLVIEIPAGVADCYAAGAVTLRVPVAIMSNLLSPLGRRIWGK